MASRAVSDMDMDDSASADGITSTVLVQCHCIPTVLVHDCDESDEKKPVSLVRCYMIGQPQIDVVPSTLTRARKSGWNFLPVVDVVLKRPKKSIISFVVADQAHPCRALGPPPLATEIPHRPPMPMQYLSQTQIYADMI